MSHSLWRRLLRGVMPAPVRRWWYVLSVLTPAERRALARETWLGRLGRLPEWRPALQNARTVSFICHGNIIRSPFAAAAFAREMRRRGHHIEVTSAGVAARSGAPADPRAAQSAEELGLSLEAHRATMLDAAHVQHADVLVVMDRLNLARLLARFPEARGRAFLLSGCRADGRVSVDEIHDPVDGTLDDVRRSHAAVLASVRRLADGIVPPPA